VEVLKCVAYIRVSTREQDEEVQRSAIEEFAKSHGLDVSAWYVDKGESGAKPFKDRPGASRLLEDLGKL
jgi:DNA invertase Pin-like site-specific DNA recombinase